MNEVLSTEEILIDLSSTGSFDNVLFELTNIIEKSSLQGKNIKINFGDLSLNKDHITSLQSVLKSFDIKIKMVFSNSTETKIAAVEAGLTVSGEKLEVAQQTQSSDDQEEEQKDEDKLVNAMNKVLAGSQEIVKEDTLYIKQTLRSGQKLEHNGNIVIIGDCKPGSEIIASGDITIWGILGGIAHAGSKGDYNSKIRAFRINAIQLRIADLLARKPDSSEMEKINKNNAFTPEEAKITDGEIVIYTD
jgi:septum site-determining protein MinC